LDTGIPVEEGWERPGIREKNNFIWDEIKTRSDGGTM